MNQSDAQEALDEIIGMDPVPINEFIKLVRKYGVSIDSTDSFGRTALSDAIYQGSIENAQALLELGASPNVQNSEGESPLHLACLYGNNAEVELLLKYNCNISLKAYSEHTPLEVAIRFKRWTTVEIMNRHIQENELESSKDRSSDVQAIFRR